MNYIGSKYSILSYIDEVVEDFVNPKKKIIFCDIFAGTGVVSKYFKEKGYNIISNDIQYFSYVLLKGLVENSEELKFEKLRRKHIDPFVCLNGLNGKKGFIYKNYSMGGTYKSEYPRLYFSDYNAKKIDAIRQKIEKWKKRKIITDNEYYYLLACLLESSDKVANTASVYEAFLKDLKKTAQKQLIIEPLEIIFKNGKYTIYNEDSKNLIRKIKGDVLYLDPPYNSRRYDTNYHILETIALYDNPKIKGKTGIRIEESKKSNYCLKNKALQEFEDLIKNAKFRYILLSYNNEGILSINDIETLFKKYGNYKRYEKSHKRFKSDSYRNYKNDQTIEYIHCLEKN